MDLHLHGRRALVTGSAGGIGAAVVRALTAEGMRVAGTDRGDAVGPDAAAAASGDSLFFPADVTDAAQVDRAVAGAVTALGGIDALVVCAGVSGPVGTALADTSLADWERVFAVNVTGAFLTLRAAVRTLTAARAASVVFVASDSALVATAGMVPYAASKAALLQLARAASVELAGAGVRVNAICPSIVDTPMSRGDLGRHDGFAGADYPVQSAEEVAGEVVFLCSERSRAINGTGLISDFGYTARSGFPA